MATLLVSNELWARQLKTSADSGSERSADSSSAADRTRTSTAGVFLQQGRSLMVALQAAAVSRPSRRYRRLDNAMKVYLENQCVAEPPYSTISVVSDILISNVMKNLNNCLIQI